jgi:hypothetical protein
MDIGTDTIIQTLKRNYYDKRNNSHFKGEYGHIQP